MKTNIPETLTENTSKLQSLIKIGDRVGLFEKTNIQNHQYYKKLGAIAMVAYILEHSDSEQQAEEMIMKYQGDGGILKWDDFYAAFWPWYKKCLETLKGEGKLDETQMINYEDEAGNIEAESHSSFVAGPGVLYMPQWYLDAKKTRGDDGLMTYAFDDRIREHLTKTSGDLAQTLTDAPPKG